MEYSFTMCQIGDMMVPALEGIWRCRDASDTQHSPYEISKSYR